VVPGQEGEETAVGRERRRGDEVGAVGQGLPFVAPGRRGERDGDERVGRLTPATAPVILADADHPVARRVEEEIGVAEGAVVDRRRQRDRIGRRSCASNR
jgi:hypothetical protein